MFAERFRMLDDLEPGDEGTLARCHDVIEWVDCAVFVVRSHDPRQWSNAAEQLRAEPSVRESGWLAGSELGWAIVDAVIERVATTTAAAFFSAPADQLLQLVEEATASG